jgi:AraC-like DNA-binding protein
MKNGKMTHTLHIRNMVCDRCRMVVADILRRHGLDPQSVILGKVTLARSPEEAVMPEVRKSLQAAGFDLLDDKRSRLVSQVKAEIIALVRERNGELTRNLSDVVRENLHYDYGYLSSLFSESEGTTIEKYFIAQKIERVKELLVYEEKTLSEIADELHYSSVAHLSAQFKRVTGLTPTFFRQVGHRRRIPLDEV